MEADKTRDGATEHQLSNGPAVKNVFSESMTFEASGHKWTFMTKLGFYETIYVFIQIQLPTDFNGSNSKELHTSTSRNSQNSRTF